MPTRTSSRAMSGSGELAAAIARTTPVVLALLADGIPRPEWAIVTALAEHHAKDDVIRTLMRLAVTERLVEQGGKFTLPDADTPRAS